MNDTLIERKVTLWKGSLLDSPIADRRRPQFERRGTAPEAPAPTREQKLYGERRHRPDAGLE